MAEGDGTAAGPRAGAPAGAGVTGGSALEALCRDLGECVWLCGDSRDMWWCDRMPAGAGTDGASVRADIERRIEEAAREDGARGDNMGFVRPRAKDGRLIYVGETVYGEDGKEWIVCCYKLDTFAVRAMGEDGATYRDLRPDQLTHEQSDSWERLANLAELLDGLHGHGDGKHHGVTVTDIVRRARALAERGTR